MKQDITLTEDQKNAFENIKEWLKNDQRYYTLAGYSGSGKTTLMDKITDYTRSKNISTRVTATTNKAVKVLMELIDHNDFSTIHKLLNIRPERKGTREIFKPAFRKNDDIGVYGLVIIDECSMISKKLLKIIEDELQGEETKVLFVGDPAQLQPINENISKCFQYESSMLTEIVRHGDVIANMSKKVRSTNDFITFRDLLAPDEIDNVEDDELMNYFEGFRDDPDKCRMLCWTNNGVKAWNKKIRAHDYNDKDLPPFVKGDIVMANEPCKMNDEIIMMNSEEGIVKSVHDYDEYYSLKIKLYDRGEAIVNVLKEEFKENISKELKRLAMSKQWTEYWSIRDFYHDVRHCYALTCHKSQGSSFGSVILDTQDISYNKDLEERNQLIYVAMTRAQNQIRFYNGF